MWSSGFRDMTLYYNQRGVVGNVHNGSAVTKTDHLVCALSILLDMVALIFLHV